MKKFKVGLQLFSIRDEMEKDMEQALRTVKEIGYDYVEFAGYFGKSAEEVRALLDKFQLECVSVHQDYSVFLENEKENIDYLKTIGAKYCAIPWMGVEKHIGHGRFELTKKEIIKVGTALRDNGIQMLYHNHDFEFESYEGKFLLDWLYESIPADILQTELDTCWVKYAGQDPAQYLRKYMGRSPIVHLKDFVCKKLNSGAVYGLIDKEGKETKTPSKEENGFEFRPLGCGMQDFAAILEAAEDAGADYVVVEQDKSTTASPMESAKISRDYLKSFGL